MCPPIRVSATSTCGVATIQLGWEWTVRFGVATSAARNGGMVSIRSKAMEA